MRRVKRLIREARKIEKEQRELYESLKVELAEAEKEMKQKEKKNATAEIPTPGETTAMVPSSSASAEADNQQPPQFPGHFSP